MKPGPDATGIPGAAPGAAQLALVVALLAFASLALFGPRIAAGMEAPAELRLRSSIELRGDTAVLADVLMFGANAEALAAQIGTQPLLRDGSIPSCVTHSQVSARLAELGVNPVFILLSGAVQCRITRAAPQDSGPVQVAEIAPQTAGPSATSALTLAEVLRASVQAEFAEPGGTVDLVFERAGQEFLQLSTPPWEFSVGTGHKRRLGLREFQVGIRRDGQLQRRVTVSAQVRLKRDVVVARTTLGIGRFVRQEEVALESRVFEADGPLGLGRIEDAVGQQVKVFVPAGALVTRESLKPVDLVARSRPVTVLGENARVQVRLTGVALDAGTLGDPIRVRVGDARGERKILRGVVTGVGTVRLVEDGL
jgi:flagella basal body P-ring formation protein FlgA